MKNRKQEIKFYEKKVFQKQNIIYAVNLDAQLGFM